MAGWNSSPAEADAALRETTNEMQALSTGPPRDEAKIKLAREKGWVQPTAYDYNAQVPPVDTESANTATATNSEMSGWMARAAKYEWKEEYGDIAPHIPELEAELFGSEYRTKKGIKFDR